MSELAVDEFGDAFIPAALESPRSERTTGSYGYQVAWWTTQKLGMVLGPWQRYAIIRALEHDADGNLVAEQALISVARQNGKSVLMRALVGWLLDVGCKLEAFKHFDLVLFAAHDAGQARIPYDYVRRDLLAWSGSKGGKGKSYDTLDRERQNVRATMFSGLGINGIKVDTATANAGATRGVSPGLILFDEVMTQKTFGLYDVLAPSQSAIKNALMILTSTAGYSDSVVLRQFHDHLYRQSVRAEQHDDRFMGLWWRAEDDDVGLDWEQLKLANPALDDGRLRRSAIEREYLILPKQSWIRERLNRWADERTDAPFTLKAWGACRGQEPLAPSEVQPDSRYVVGVDVASDFSAGCIVVAGMRRDGRVGLEVHRYLEGRADQPLTALAFTSEIARLATKIDVGSVVYSASSALAPAFARHQIETQIPYEPVQSAKTLLCCADFAEAVTSARLVVNDTILDGQIAGAQRRFVGDGGAWKWAISASHITGVVASTYAVSWAARGIGQVQIFV